MTEAIRLWHVTVTVAGDALEPLIVRNASAAAQRAAPVPALPEVRRPRAEIQYWDEAETLLDASSLALRVWNEHRDSAASRAGRSSASRSSSAAST